MNFKALLFSLFAVLYNIILIYMTKFSPWFSTALIVGAPTILLLFRKPQRLEPRLLQIIIIGYIFMISVTLGVVGFFQDIQFLKVMGTIGFFAYFCVQTVGFALDCWKKNSFEGLAIVGIGGGVILPLWFTSLSDTSLVVETGFNIYVLGSPAPWWVIASYVFWFIVVITNGSPFPKLSELIVQSTSVFVSILSGQFFFARVMTASHMFVLDLFFNYSRRDFLGADTMILSQSYFETRWVAHRRIIAWCCLVAILTLAVIGFIETTKLR